MIRACTASRQSTMTAAARSQYSAARTPLTGPYPSPVAITTISGMIPVDWLDTEDTAMSESQKLIKYSAIFLAVLVVVAVLVMAIIELSTILTRVHLYTGPCTKHGCPSAALRRAEIA